MKATAAHDRAPQGDAVVEQVLPADRDIARSSPCTRIGPWLATVTATACCLAASAAEFVHEASGVRFPASIEGRFLRGAVKEDGKQCTVTYSTQPVLEVVVLVQPAKPGAKGPTRLDGDQHSDASPEFKDELAKCVRDRADGLEGATVVSQMRFHAGPQTGSILQRGPIGMKATVRGKLDGKVQVRELLLLERNGFFIRFTTSHAGENWLKSGLIYTDVAHFLGWPATANPQASTPHTR